MELREKIARLVADYEPDESLACQTAEDIADAILAIPEIKEALEVNRHWSDGVELPSNLVERMKLMYGEPTHIRVTDDAILLGGLLTPVSKRD